MPYPEAKIGIIGGIGWLGTVSAEDLLDIYIACDRIIAAL
jgi:hypothetical protein